MSNQDDNQRQDVGQYIKLDPKDAFYLQRTQVLKDLQEEMGKWSKKQFAWISIVCLIGGWIGIPLIVANIAESEVAQLQEVVAQAKGDISDVVHEAEHATSEAVIATRTATLATHTATKDIGEFQFVLADIQATADRIDETLKNLSERITLEGAMLSEGIDLSSQSLSARLESMELRMNELLEKSDPPSAREFSTEQSRLKTQSDQVRATFRGTYTIWLDDLSRRTRRNPRGQREDLREQGQNEITTKLRALGFRVAGSVRARPRDAIIGSLVRSLRLSAVGSSIVVLHHPDTSVPDEILQVLLEIRGKPATLITMEQCPKLEIFISLPVRSPE